jgi:exodeoxyribonuclease-1
VYEPPMRPPESDPELRIYQDGFFPDADAALFPAIHGELAKGAKGADKDRLYALRFEDDRPAQLLRRLFGRNFPEILGEAEAGRWRSFCARRLQFPPTKDGTDLATFTKILTQKLESPDTPARERGLLLALLDYKSALERDVMDYPGV